MGFVTSEKDMDGKWEFPLRKGGRPPSGDMESGTFFRATVYNLTAEARVLFEDEDKIQTLRDEVR